MAQQRNPIRMSGDYVAKVGCGIDHSGNRGLAGNDGAWSAYFECQGCGHFYYADWVREEQARLSAPLGRAGAS
jgi:hypothetical protein